MYVCITLSYDLKDAMAMACKLLSVACVSLTNNLVIISTAKFREDVCRCINNSKIV